VIAVDDVHVMLGNDAEAGDETIVTVRMTASQMTAGVARHRLLKLRDVEYPTWGALVMALAAELTPLKKKELLKELAREALS
jgi:hypothetical protein